MAAGRQRTYLLSIAALAALLTPGCFSDCDLKIQTSTLPQGTVGVDYRFRFDSDCGGDAWFVSEGVLPPGVQLQSDGDLRGAPTAAGIFNFTVGVVDYRKGETAFKGFQITVVAAVPAPTPTPTPAR